MGRDQPTKFISVFLPCRPGYPDSRAEAMGTTRMAKMEVIVTENTSLVQVKEAAAAILSLEVVERHSLLQLPWIVLAKEPTIQGKLQQCVREIKARQKSLDGLELEIEEQMDKLELIGIDIEDLSGIVVGNSRSDQLNAIKLRGLERKRRSAANSLKELEKKLKEISEELKVFCSAFDQLNRREKLKPWVDPDVPGQTHQNPQVIDKQLYASTIVDVDFGTVHR